MSFLTDDFLLHNDVARELYHEHARHEPILDYHNHLPPDQVAGNKQFRNLFEIWLAGDHYKWRAMRANGVPERFITGDASDWEKFLAFALTVPRTVRNPLYHWTHLELERFFGIRELLNEQTARRIWDEANEKLATPAMSAQGILKSSKVVALCTTDDPAGPLPHHEALAANPDAPVRMFPTFRPDGAMIPDDPEKFRAWIARLEAVSGENCSGWDGFQRALARRHEAFHSVGCRVSDHGMETVLAEACTESEAAGIYERALQGQAAGPEETRKFGSFLMLVFGRLDAERGWAKQLHLGALRNVNTRMAAVIGKDAGFDTIGSYQHAAPLARYLNALDSEDKLPKTILYNLNPADNYVFACMIGNFQGDGIPGKIQFGSGWWFLDQKEGMEWQLNALSSLGLLSRFIGMLTDSRSFLSFTRHEYFRRILCNMLGRDVANGELPRDMDLLGGLVRDVCFRNAQTYFQLPGV